MRTYLRGLRNQFDMTQEQVAKKLGVKRQYYNLIENGNRQKKMDLPMMQKLADAFGVSVEYIVTEETKLQSTAS